jgi:hypothetical protein
MSNQVEGSLKILWPFQNVRTLYAIFALYFIVLLFNLSDRNLFCEAEGS